ncbi:MAG TPA: DUF309 domain-containing protein [Desulfuromonadaceae bacterium]
MVDCTQSPSGALLRALGEFNRQEWFECHETLEELWVGSEGEERDFYQGILQVAVGLLHWRRGNFKGAVLLLTSGAEKLSRVRPVCQRIDVGDIVTTAVRFREDLTSLGAEKMADMDPALIPSLRLVPAG